MQFSLNALKFEDIRQNIVNYLKEKNPTLADFDFNGSNISLIIDSMAYTTMLMNYHLSHLANEMFLDTTEIRKNAISISKTIGYTPKRKIPSKFTGKIQYTGTNFTEDSVIIIPQKTIFKSSPNGYIFVNIEPIRLTYKSPILLEGDFILYQGEFKEYRTLGNGLPLQSFTIPSANVSELFFNLYVKNTNDEDNKKELWKHLKTFFNIPTNNKFYFIEEDVINEYHLKIVFGNGNIGKIPSISETIICEYFETLGEKGNNETSISFADVNNIDFIYSNNIIFDTEKLNIYIPTNSYSFGGEDNESLYNIKNNAPKYFSSAGRGITEEDYRNILSNYKNIRYFNIIGANEFISPDLKGLIYITAVPFFNIKTNDITEKLYLNDIEEIAILSELKNIGVISINKTFIKPTYILVEITPYVEILPNLNIDNINRLFSEIVENIYNYFDNYISKLNGNFRSSKISSFIINTFEEILSAYIENKYSVILYKDSFYKDKENIMHLPVIYKKDENGFILYDENNRIITTNFIKRNVTIIEEENQNNNTNYDVYTLPPEKSSLFGEFFTLNNKRYIYNKDVITKECAYINFIDDIFVYKGFKFLDFNNVNHEFYIYESGIQNTWNLYIDKIKVATIIKNNNNLLINTTNYEKSILKDNFNIQSLYIENKNINNELTYIIKMDIINVESAIRVYSQKNFLELIYSYNDKKFYITNSEKYYLDGAEFELDINSDIDHQSTILINNIPLFNINAILGNVKLNKVIAYFENNQYNTVNFTNYFGVEKTVSIDNNIIKFDSTEIATINSDNTINIINNNELINNKIYDLTVDSNNNIVINIEIPLIQASNYGYIINNDIIFSQDTISFTLTNVDKNLMNKLEFNSDIEIVNDQSNITLKVKDIYHDSLIGIFNYITGELRFEKMIKGYLDNETPIEITVYKFFESYNNKKYLYIKPDNLYNNKNMVIGTLTDFDGKFNTFILPKIYIPIIKKV